MKIKLITKDNSLHACDHDSEEWMEKQTDGKYFEAEITAPRNARFHRLFFKLLSIAYKHWQPLSDDVEVRNIQKNFEQFREDVTIMAGYHEWVYRTDGKPRLRAKSISFANMDNEEFKVFYDKVLTVIIQRVLVGWTIEQIDEEIGRFL